MQPRLREPTAPLRDPAAAATGASRVAGRGAWRLWGRNLVIAAAAGVFLALSGAMQTGAMPLAARLLYWVPLVLAGAVLARGVSALVAMIPRAAASRWLFGALLATAISAPITLLVWAYANFVFSADMSAAALPRLFASVFVIAAAMTAIMIGVNWPGRVTHAAPGPETAAPIRFLERLTPKLRGAKLYAVSAEDHYLRLHTSKGADLILMRLGDAMGELEGIDGAQVHRSWWVARDAVEGVRREGDRVVLLLKDGVEAPVSRPNIRPLRQAGWF